jgi:hypothetical protein
MLLSVPWVPCTVNAYEYFVGKTVVAEGFGLCRHLTPSLSASPLCCVLFICCEQQRSGARLKWLWSNRLLFALDVHYLLMERNLHEKQRLCLALKPLA